MTGWVFPSRRFVECNTYEHSLLEDEEFLDVVGDEIAELDAVEEGCEELGRREGQQHAEWHVYEMARDDLNPKIYKKLLSKGFIRVGQRGNTVHFEGRPWALKKLMDFCKTLAKDKNFDYKFEPQKGK